MNSFLTSSVQRTKRPNKENLKTLSSIHITRQHLQSVLQNTSGQHFLSHIQSFSIIHPINRLYQYSANFNNIYRDQNRSNVKREVMIKQQRQMIGVYDIHQQHLGQLTTMKKLFHLPVHHMGIMWNVNILALVQIYNKRHQKS